MIETTIKVNDTMSMTKLTASDGMVLTNDTIYGNEIYLGLNDSPSNWHEIPESEVPSVDDYPSLEEELADAKDALKILGVE